MRVPKIVVPDKPRFYPPIKGDQWGDGAVEAYGYDKSGKLWVRLGFVGGMTSLLRGLPPKGVPGA